MSFRGRTLVLGLVPLAGVGGGKKMENTFVNHLRNFLYNEPCDRLHLRHLQE